MAAVADPDFELKAHEGDGRALGATLAAHGLPTFPAVVLEEKERGCRGSGCSPGTPAKQLLSGEDTRPECPELATAAEPYNPSTGEADTRQPDGDLFVS